MLNREEERVGNWQVAVQKMGKWTEDGEQPRIYVSLNKRGEIALNPEAHAAIRRPWNVTLLWDARRRRIGVKFPVKADKDHFSVREYGRGRRMRIVSGGRMLKQFGIEIERTLAFRDVRVEMIDNAPMLVLDLDAGKPIE